MNLNRIAHEICDINRYIYYDVILANELAVKIKRHTALACFGNSRSHPCVDFRIIAWCNCNATIESKGMVSSNSNIINCNITYRNCTTKYKILQYEVDVAVFKSFNKYVSHLLVCSFFSHCYIQILRISL